MKAVTQTARSLPMQMPSCQAAEDDCQDNQTHANQ